jgi:RimJ/RimL family protein N-acetyltransferase
MMLKEKIIGERVYLQSLNERDASDEYCGWLNDPEVNKFLATKSADKQGLSDYILKKNSQSDAIFLGIFLKESNKHIGTIKLEPIDLKTKKAVIAIMVGDKKSWGKGYGGEAMKILIDYAHKKMHIDTMELGVIGDNLAAINSYVKLGFAEVKRELKAVQYGENVYDQVTMLLELR